MKITTLTTLNTLMQVWVGLMIVYIAAFLLLLLCDPSCAAPLAPTITGSNGAQIALQFSDKHGCSAIIPDGKDAFLVAPDHKTVLDVECWILQQDNTVAIFDRDDGSLITTIDGSAFGFTNTTKKEKHGNL